MKKQDGKAPNPTLADFEQVHNLFFRPGELTEIRCFGLYGNNEAWAGYAKGTISGYFDNPTDFAKAALALDRAEAAGVYFVQNPVNPALLARASNRLKAAEATTADKDVVCLRHLYLDFDPERPKGISATDEEIELARQSMEVMREHLKGMGWPEGLRAFSGNGWHCVHWLPDLPNDKEHVDLIKKALEAADRLFSTDRVKVDRVNFNHSRIGKLYASTARKGDNTADRPHRRSYSDQSCSNGWRPQALTVEQLKWLADQAPETDRDQEHASLEDGWLDVARYLEHYGRAFHVKEHEVGTMYVFDACPFEDQHTGNTTRGDSGIIQQASGKLLFKCFHAHCAGRIWADMRRAISGEDELALFWIGGRKTTEEKHASADSGGGSDGSYGSHGIDLQLIEPVPFPFEAFPPRFQDLIQTYATALQVGLEPVALMMMGVLSGAIGNTIRVSVKDGWEIPPFLWVAIIKETGYGQSPAQNAVLRPVKRLQAIDTDRYNNARLRNMKKPVGRLRRTKPAKSPKNRRRHRSRYQTSP